MIQLANRYMRRLRLYNPAYDAEDAVHDTLIKLLHRADDCQLDSVQSTVDFWRAFFSMLKCEIRDAWDYFGFQGHQVSRDTILVSRDTILNSRFGITYGVPRIPDP